MLSCDIFKLSREEVKKMAELTSPSKSSINNLISAIQFLTILPIKKSVAFDPKGMMQYFPIVGLIVGGMLSLFDMAVSQLWPGPAVAILDVIFLVLVTAALHLDGLGDTADGLYGNSSREKALAIMKDSRIGAMGLVAIVCGLSLKWSGMMSLADHRSLFLLIIPAYARSGMLFGFKFLEYGRPDGTGRAFFSEPLTYSAFWGLIIPVSLSLFAGWRGIFLNIVFIITVALILLYYKRRMGCITGDMLGAMCEITEAVLFLVVSCRF
jgi:adenosylcobinamide-GDP ribazoletransferase